MVARNEVLTGLMEPTLTEAMSCKEALSWLKSLGYNKVIVESNAQQLIHALQDSNGDLSYFGFIVDDCKIMSKDLGEYLFVFAKRLANQVAHSLVRAAGSMFDRRVWFFSLPLFISHILALDNYE